MQENRSLVLNVYHSVNHVQLEDYLKSWLKPILSSIVNEVAQSMEISQENREFVTDVYVLMMVGFFMEWMEYDMPKDKLGKLDKLFYCMDGSIAYTLGKFEETKGAVAKRKWSNSPVFCGKVVLCSILGYKLLKSLSPKGKNGTAKLGFSGEERSSFLHFPVVKKSILFSGERDDFSAVPVAVWPSTFSGQRPGRAGTVPVRYWSCPA